METATYYRRNMPMVLLFVVSAVVFTYASLQIFSITRPEANWPTHITIVFGFWFVPFLVLSYLTLRSFYLFIYAYVVMLALFHLGAIIPAGIGLLEVADLGSYSRVGLGSSVWAEKAAWYTLTSLACLSVGFSVAVFWTSRRAILSSPTDLRIATLDRAFWAGLGLSLASLLFLGHAVVIFGNLLQYERFDFFSTTEDRRSLGAFFWTFPASITLLVIGARGRFRQWTMFCIAAVSVALLLLAGNRGIAFHPLLIGAIVWVKTGRRFPAAMAIAMIGFVLIVIPIVENLRMMGTYEELSVAKFMEATQETEIIQGFLSMGSTVRSLEKVIVEVPNNYPYRYGTTYLMAAVASIPNLGLTRSEGRLVSVPWLTSPAFNFVDDLSPSNWLSYQIIGLGRSLKGEGLGFTGIGEPYFNFGYPGVVFYFLVLGFLLGRMDLCDLLRHPKLLIFAAAMYPNFIGTARNEFTTALKPAVFMLIILVIWQAATLFVRSKNREIDKAIQ